MPEGGKTSPVTEQFLDIRCNTVSIPPFLVIVKPWRVNEYNYMSANSGFHILYFSGAVLEFPGLPNVERFIACFVNDHSFPRRNG